MIKKNFVASRIKDHKSNIVTKMWNIQTAPLPIRWSLCWRGSSAEGQAGKSRH